MRKRRRDAHPTVSFEEFRSILAKLPGSLADAVLADRADR
jgi:hypothetical protein